MTISETVLKLLNAPKQIKHNIFNKVSTFRNELAFNQEYRKCTRPKMLGHFPHTEETDQLIIQQLKKNNLRVRKFRIDPNGYEQFIQSAGYEEFNYYNRGTANNFSEKSLEHYLATLFLEISDKDIYFDIASAGSPVPEIYQNLFNCETYRQDLEYVPGLHDHKIGGDAAAMPVEDGFVNKMAMHCSFEHFERDADIRFIKEANRVLAPGGKLCILPLYLCPEYLVYTDPNVWPQNNNLVFEEDAKICFVKNWGNRHGRFYDVEHFIERVVRNLGQLRLTLFFVKNQKEIHPTCYIKFIALLEKP